MRASNNKQSYWASYFCYDSSIETKQNQRLALNSDSCCHSSFYFCVFNTRLCHILLICFHADFNHWTLEGRGLIIFSLASVEGQVLPGM